MRIPTTILALIAACVLAAAGPLHAAGKYVSVDYPASTVDGELQIAVTYTIWIPDGVKILRGIIVHQHGAGIPASKAGATAAYDLHWQALAKKWDCALLGPSYHVLNEGTQIGPGEAELWYDPRRGSDKVFLKAASKPWGDQSQVIQNSALRFVVSLGTFRRRAMGQHHGCSSSRPGRRRVGSFRRSHPIPLAPSRVAQPSSDRRRLLGPHDDQRGRQGKRPS